MPTVSAPRWSPKDHPQPKYTTALVDHRRTRRRPSVHPRTPPVSSPLAQTVVQPRHDPHHLPTFDLNALVAPSEPILYLPPLLSSLPTGYIHPPVPTSNYRPLTTDTRLPNIDPVSLSLHRALHDFHPVTPEYALTPYEEAFNWSEMLLPEEAEREWYCVVFRSKRKEGSDGGRKYNITSSSQYVSAHVYL